MTTPEAIRATRLYLDRGIVPVGVRAALEQLLTAVEEAELVIGQFAAITAMADHKRYSNNVVWVNLTDRDFDAARDWRAKHGSAGQ